MRLPNHELMSTPTSPPPFGDPTNIQRENAAAVKKGLLVGCGGCFFIVVAGVTFMVAIFAMVMFSMRSTEACQQALRVAQKSEVMKAELGEPMSLGWFVTGNVNSINGQGTAKVEVPIRGPKGSAKVHVSGTSDAKQGWHFTQMDALIEGRTEPVNLLAP